MLRLEDLQVDTRVAGIEPSAPVKLLYIQVAGEDAADLPHDGRVPKRKLWREGLSP